jgi:hypothetical protein
MVTDTYWLTKKESTMKRMMSIAAVALLVVASAAVACDTCGCKAKKADTKKAACTACAKDKACTACTKDKACAGCAKKAEAKDAAAKKAK